MTLWRVMTPTTSLGDRRWVHWDIAARFRHEAVRMAEQAALELGITFIGDIEVARVGPVYVPMERTTPASVSLPEGLAETKAGGV